MTNREDEDSMSGRTLLIIVIIGIMILLIFCKYVGTLPSPVEKQGYCKIIYGDDWKYDKLSGECYGLVNKTKVSYNFSEEQFRDVCPKNKFFSSNLFSYCFNEVNRK